MIRGTVCNFFLVEGVQWVEKWREGKVIQVMMWEIDGLVGWWNFRMGYSKDDPEKACLNAGSFLNEMTKNDDHMPTFGKH